MSNQDPQDDATLAICFDRVVRQRDELRDALRLLVADVADYPAWQRPCHALDIARAALSKVESR